MKKGIIVLTAAAFLGACSTDPYTGEEKLSNTAWGAGIGTVAGAGLGAGVGALTAGKKGAAKGAAIGAGAGLVAGTGTGAYMDVQARKLRQELLSTGVQVQQDGNKIILIMPGNVTFGTNEATIATKFEPVLTSVAKVINEYDKTMVQIIGYTDNTGTVATNNALSLRRANAVSNYLRLRGVDLNRIIVDGLGPQNPVASNHTAAGREQNRRVEITLINKQ